MELWVELHARTKQGTLTFKAILPKEVVQNNLFTMLADTPLKVDNIHLAMCCVFLHFFHSV